jgi:peptide/nickel transport system substrate-binding protein
MVDDYKRRDVLRRAGLASAAGVGVSIAGCSANDEGQTETADSGMGGDDAGTETDQSPETVTANPGQRIRAIDFVSDSEDVGTFRYEWGLIVTENLRELGFEVNYINKRGSDYVNTFRVERDFDVGAYRSGSGFGPDRYVSEYYSSDQLTPGGGNFAGWINSEYDDWVTEQRRTTDSESRKELTNTMQETVMEPAPVWIPVMYQDRIMPLNTDRFRNPEPLPQFVLIADHNMFTMEPRDGVDTLRYGFPNPLPGINPVNFPPRGMQQTTLLVYDRLMRIKPPDNTPQPWAAESVNQVDATTIEVTLRDGLTFHDGEDLTAEDVKFSLNYVNENTAGRLSDITSPIGSISVESDVDLVINLDYGYAPLFTRTFVQVPLIPKHIWQNIPEEIDEQAAVDWPNPDPVGSGPLKVDEWRRGEQLVMSAFEDHFNPPNIPNFVRIPGSDKRSLIRAVEQGELDMMSVAISPGDANRLSQTDSVETFAEQMFSTHMFIPNHRRKPFDDPAVRRALAHSVPKEDIVQTVMGGAGTVPDAPLPPALDFWYNGDAGGYEFDLEQARQELEDAGYQWDDQGRILYPEEDG